MEKKLSNLFDYQKFAGNPKLQAVIDSAHKQPRTLLFDDDAELVAAAGSPYYKPAGSDDESQL